MNGKEREKLAVLDERVRNMQKNQEDKFNAMHDDIKEIKTSVSGIKGCIHTTDLAVKDIDGKLAGHFKSHKIVADISKRTWVKISILIGATISITSIIVGVIF